LNALIQSAAGGMLIGLASGAMMLALGRVAGVSGALAGVLELEHGRWKLGFVAGVIFAGVAARGLGGWSPPATSVSIPVAALAGLLVGAGSRLANGCTSGHGVCGLSRLSVRSMVAVATFLASGIAVTYVSRHLGGPA
jgi:uncharacterized membrane protein YedE/YeeE